MREEILNIASDLREGSMRTSEAKEQLLVLFGVVGRSEQFYCKNNQGNNREHMRCQSQCKHCEECEALQYNCLTTKILTQ